MLSKLCSFYKLLNQLGGKEYFETFISYNVALISAKLKPAITLNFKKEDKKRTHYLWDIYGENCLMELGLKHVKLRETDDSLIVLIYDTDLLQRVIKKSENLNVLTNIGYEKDSSLEEVVIKLIHRYELYNCPHELGIFLGYPIEDVKSFMNCEENKCLGCGYWKVYNEYNKAKVIFSIYDSVRVETIDNILIGNKHVELSSILRTKFELNQEIIF
ncbi:MAG: DUF3793 family protein [Clostridium sp.]|uniref:DUF3793 family protein n=1 Tax=Clostridium sp. TaxID=1506 RepID=UPI0030433DA0